MEKKICRISVKNLFGFLNHDIHLSEDGVTFIHGPNGCGKTTFLKLIAAFYDWNPATLGNISYEEVDFFYLSGERIHLSKSIELKKFEDEEIETPKLQFFLYINEKETKSYTIERNLKELKVSRSDIDDYISSIHRVGPNSWIDVKDNEQLSFNEVLEKYSYRFPFSSRKKRPEWLQAYQESSKFHFVQTQRLLKVNTDRRLHREEIYVNDVIDIYSMEIKEKISKKLEESAAVSQSKDRSFPERLLSLRLDEKLSEQEIRDDYKKTEDKIAKLMNSGLIEQEKNISLPDKVFEATEKKVLSLYLQDINEKLSIFDDLLLRLEIFLDIISTKLRNKKFRVSRQDGFVIETTQGKKNRLEPNELSSGEQHQIVLFYELIFKTDDNSFFLIDEPEISLHVDWQRQFLSDISRIAELGSHSFVIATHSPQIIGNRRDLAVALDGGILGG
ncbi:AAA family ATPase [Marichromatium purpuratum]|uniref:AAA family ATPase n=1 Tax=Marichromatium purpuratum TaxID=37487 RepID=UPI00021E6954|nr:AAA family ATPase [Marichromatium purpuratum]